MNLVIDHRIVPSLSHIYTGKTPISQASGVIDRVTCRSSLRFVPYSGVTSLLPADHKAAKTKVANPSVIAQWFVARMLAGASRVDASIQ